MWSVPWSLWSLNSTQLNSTQLRVANINSRGHLRDTTFWEPADNTPPQPGWRCPCGRRRISWQHQICTDLNLPVSETLNLTTDRTSWRAVSKASGLCAKCRVLRRSDPKMRATKVASKHRFCRKTLTVPDAGRSIWTSTTSPSMISVSSLNTQYASNLQSDTTNYWNNQHTWNTVSHKSSRKWTKILATEDVGNVLFSTRYCSHMHAYDEKCIDIKVRKRKLTVTMTFVRKKHHGPEAKHWHWMLLLCVSVIV